MKKSPFPAALLFLGVFVAGCPVYDSTDGDCFDDSECPYGSVCDGHTNRCAAGPSSTAVACYRPSDCDANETCNRVGICSTGDCHFASVGCVRGYECSAESGRWQCVKPGSSVNDGGNAGAPSAGASTVEGGASTVEGGASDGGTPGAGG